MACAEKLQAEGYETDLGAIQAGAPPNPSADAAVFCFPVHALDLPRNAVSYLRGLPAAGNIVPAVLLVTGGDPDNCGWALASGTRILAERGYAVRIADLIHMPNNWTPFHSAPDSGDAERLIRAGVWKAESCVERFVNGESFRKPIVLRKFGAVGSALMRFLFHKRGVYKLWMFFRADARCTGCGLCARICPTGSIRMADGKPAWSAGCVQCMRCFNYCPQGAIRQLEFWLHGSRHRAYRLPGFTPTAET